MSVKGVGKMYSDSGNAYLTSCSLVLVPWQLGYSGCKRRGEGVLWLWWYSLLSLNALWYRYLGCSGCRRRGEGVLWFWYSLPSLHALHHPFQAHTVRIQLQLSAQSSQCLFLKDYNLNWYRQKKHQGVIVDRNLRHTYQIPVPTKESQIAMIHKKGR